MVGGFHSIDASLPNTTGSFRRIDLALRENCVVGIIRHPTSTSVATSNVADRVANPVQCAIAEIAAGQCLAECSAVIPPTVAVIAGIHPKTGGAAAPNADAWLTIGHVGNAGMCNLDSVELDKMRQPIHVHSCRLLPDTKGAGQHIGAPSIEVAFGPVGCDISVGYVSDGMVNPARGVRGMGAGALALALAGAGALAGVSGTIRFDDKHLDRNAPENPARAGIALVPQRAAHFRRADSGRKPAAGPNRIPAGPSSRCAKNGHDPCHDTGRTEPGPRGPIGRPHDRSGQHYMQDARQNR